MLYSSRREQSGRSTGVGVGGEATGQRKHLGQLGGGAGSGGQGAGSGGRGAGEQGAGAGEQLADEK